MHTLFNLLLLAAGTLAQCPPLKLPWGAYDGVLGSHQICHYKDVRFASPPVGKLRFQAPKYPPSPQDSPHPKVDYPSCIAMEETSCLPGNPSYDNPSSCFPGYFGTQTEDCLFLDIYMHSSVLKARKPVPVIVWIYGGAFVFGSKTQYDFSLLPFYDGDGTVSNGWGNSEQFIFVAGNYRLGAFGWLAGTYMEKNAQPNAGLLDQRAVLQFVNEHIAKLNGDPASVSVWGESAGASSILHHITSPSNIQKPLFRNAVLQSPAYQWLWQRNTTVNDTFTTLAKKAQTAAKCKAADLQCLQSLSTEQLTKLNQGLFKTAACNGIMPVGPTVDGQLIPDLAPNQISNKKFTKLNSIIVSHVDLEVPYSNSTSGFSFIPLPIRKSPESKQAFDLFLNQFMPGKQYKPLRDSVKKRYKRHLYTDQIARAAAVIMDSSFLCNTRFLIDAYSQTGTTKTYAMDYAFGMSYTNPITKKTSTYNGSTHASDLVPLFANQDIDYGPLLKCLLKNSSFSGLVAGRLKNSVGPGMQTYFTKLALYDDPSYSRGWFGLPTWSQAQVQNCTNGKDTCVGKVMRPQTALFINSPFKNNSYVDPQTNSSTCAFWANMSSEVMRIAGKQPGKPKLDTGMGFGDFVQHVINGS